MEDLQVFVQFCEIKKKVTVKIFDISAFTGLKYNSWEIFTKDFLKEAKYMADFDDKNILKTKAN